MKTNNEIRELLNEERLNNRFWLGYLFGIIITSVVIILMKILFS
jgi:hypothetical protein